MATLSGDFNVPRRARCWFFVDLSTQVSTIGTMATEAVRVRPETKAKLERFAKPRRLKLVEVADLAIDALTTLPKEQQDALIERRAVDAQPESSTQPEPEPEPATSAA